MAANILKVGNDPNSARLIRAIKLALIRQDNRKYMVG